MTAWLLLSTALAADPLDTLPAKLAGTTSWEERTAAVQALLDAETDEARRARLASALRVVTLLAEREADVDRGRLRALVQASVSKQEVPRAEARKAATLGAALPEIPSEDGWIPRVPVPLGELEIPSLVLAPPDLGATGLAAGADELSAQLAAAAQQVGWPVGEAGEHAIHGTASALYGASWAGRPGFGVDVSWTVKRGDDPVYRVVTRGFDPGPLDYASAEVMLRGALFNLLAQDALVATLQASADAPAPADDATLELVELGSLCLYRKKHADVRPLVVDVGGQAVKVFDGSWGCLDVPAGTRVHSEGTPGEAKPIVAGERLVLQVAHAANPGWSALTVEDGAAFDKLTGKGKLTETRLSPEP
jgi:hypothetical protein